MAITTTVYEVVLRNHLELAASPWTRDGLLCVVCVFFPFILDIKFVGRASRVTQEEGHAGFFIHLPSAVLALIFLARRIQLFLSLVDREVEFLYMVCMYGHHI